MLKRPISLVRVDWLNELHLGERVTLFGMNFIALTYSLSSFAFLIDSSFVNLGSPCNRS